MYTGQEWFDKLSEKLIAVFGKDTFSEDELNKEFYVEFYISCNEFFRNEEGIVNHEDIWNKKLKEWLMKEKN